MKWIMDFLHLPMTWDVTVPAIVLILFALLLTWESRLPPEKKILKKLCKRPLASNAKNNVHQDEYDKLTIE